MPLHHRLFGTFFGNLWPSHFACQEYRFENGIHTQIRTAIAEWLLFDPGDDDDDDKHENDESTAYINVEAATAFMICQYEPTFSTMATPLFSFVSNKNCTLCYHEPCHTETRQQECLVLDKVRKLIGTTSKGQAFLNMCKNALKEGDYWVDYAGYAAKKEIVEAFKADIHGIETNAIRKFQDASAEHNRQTTIFTLAGSIIKDRNANNNPFPEVEVEMHARNTLRLLGLMRRRKEGIQNAMEGFVILQKRMVDAFEKVHADSVECKDIFQEFIDESLRYISLFLLEEQER